MLDKVTSDRIAKSHPKVRQELLTIVNEVDLVLSGKADMRAVQVLRTIEEQNALFNQPWDHKDNDGDGKIDESDEKVTNAKGGQSYHNFGLALDFCLMVDGKVSWDMGKDWDADGKSDWGEVVAVFKKYGWEWGGNWTSMKDYPHFQKTFGYSWQQLLAKYNAKDFIPGTTYVKI